MFVIRIIFEFYIFLHFLATTQALEQLPIVENNNIAGAETVIRDTFNDLFAAFKISGISKKTRIKQYSTIHNFFVSITLKDCDTLNKITRLTTINNIDNGTKHFIAQINEVLNEGDNTTSANEDDNNAYVAKYINLFIKKLKNLKDTHASYTNNVIKSDILQYLNDDKKQYENITFDKNTDLNSSNIKEQVQSDDEILNDEYWREDTRRLFKGKRTNIKKFPFMASIHFFNKFQCAGSILSNDLIITSASCLQIAWNNRFFRENPAFLSVRVGCDFYDLCGEIISVLEIFFHPQYEPRTLRHNLAIMRLSRLLHLRFSKGYIKKIDFDRNPWTMSINSRITAVGWGAKDDRNFIYDVFQNKLSYSTLEYFPLSDCQSYYSKDFVNHYNFCAGFLAKGGGACSHDAGGPGIQNSILLGVISFGSPICGAPNIPTVFTKVGYYADWIEDILDKEYPASYRGTTKAFEYVFTLPEQTTTQLIKIEPFGFDKPKKQAKVLRVPEAQAFQDFLSTMFESEEVKAYIETSDIEPNTEIDKGVQPKLTTQNIEEPIDTDEVEQTSIETTTEVLKYTVSVNEVNENKEDKITEIHVESHDKIQKYENVKTNVDTQKLPKHTYKTSSTKRHRKEFTPDEQNKKFNNVSEGTRNVPQGMPIENRVKSMEELTTSIPTYTGDDDKMLEESIKNFIDNLDLNNYKAPQKINSGISADKTKQGTKSNKILQEGLDSPNARSVLDLLFFSDDDAEETDNEKGLNIA